MTMSQDCASSRRTIFLADDEHDLRARLARELRRDGHGVVEVCDGAELLDLLGDTVEAPESRPDLVVADARMPGFAGLSVLLALQRYQWRLPFVVMTRPRDQNLAPRARRFGAAAVFKKPIALDELRTVIAGTTARVA